MSSKNKVNPDHYKVAGRQRPGEKALQSTEKARYSNARKNKADDDAETFLPGSRASQVAAKSSGKVKSRQTRTSKAAAEERSARPEGGATQVSAAKRGVRSGAQKQDRSRHDTNPAPPAQPVPGAFGKSGSLSDTEESIIDTEPRSEKEEGERDDFLEERRRQNRRAKK